MNAPVCLLSTKALSCGYQQIPLIQQLNLHCRTNEITAILGTNGRGKTTLLHTLMGLLAPLSGSVEHACSIGFVPQIFTPAFSYQVLDIVLMGRAQHIGMFGSPNKQDIDIAREALTSLNIAELAECYFNQLSGGQRQLVLIARALASQCQVLILDEPTAALDLRNQETVLRLIYQLAKQQNLSVLFTTHDPAHAQAIADHGLLLMDNLQHLLGERNQVLTEDNLSRLYHVPVKKVQLNAQNISWVPTYQINSLEKP